MLLSTIAGLFSFLLSLLLPGEVCGGVVDSSREGAYVRCADSKSEFEGDYVPGKDFCITATQGQSFSGEGNSNSVSPRTTSGGRRVQTQSKSTFRILKCGKVVDNNNIHPFLTSSFIILSGTCIHQRYLYAICRLRL